MSIFGHLKKFLVEMKRRKVFHVGSIYLITAWGASLGAAELFPAFGIPDWGVRAFVITALLGFPIALTLAWAFEITPDGVMLDSKVRTDRKAINKIAEMESSATTLMQGDSVRVRWVSEDTEYTKEFNNDFLIGRDPEADVCLVASRISRLHAKVTCDQGVWSIADLSSRNGTQLNGKIIDTTTPLADFNEIKLYDGAEAIQLIIRHLADETVFD